MYLDHRSKEIRLHWSAAICSNTVSWNNIPAVLHSHQTSAPNSHLQHFHRLSMWLTWEPRAGSEQGTPRMVGMPRAGRVCGCVAAGWVLCRMKGGTHRGGYQTWEGVFPLSCIPFLFGSILLKEDTRWIFNYFQDFPEIPISPYSPVSWHGQLRYPPRDSAFLQACDGGGTTTSHSTAEGTGSHGRGSQMHREEITRESCNPSIWIYPILSMDKKFFNTPPHLPNLVLLQNTLVISSCCVTFLTQQFNFKWKPAKQPEKCHR